MPEATFLHIQSHESGTSRVREISGLTVRIGRGPQCEVRLEGPTLADVQCLLRRRGTIWFVQPVGPSGLLTLDGLPVEHQRPLPPGAILSVGPYALALRLTSTGQAPVGSFERPIEVDRSVPYEGPGPTTVAGNAAIEERSSRQTAWLERWKAASKALRAKRERDPRDASERPASRRWSGSTPTGPDRTPRGGRTPFTLPAPLAAAMPPEPISPQTGFGPIKRPPADSTAASLADDPSIREKLPEPSVQPELLVPDAPWEEVGALLAQHLDSQEPALAPPPSSGPLPPPIDDAPTVVVPSDRATARPTNAIGPHPFVAHTAETGVWAPPDWGTRSATIATRPEPEFPSVQDVLKQYQIRTMGAVRPDQPATGLADREPSATEAAPPAYWRLPSWLGAISALTTVLVLGGAGMALCAFWALDDRAAAIVANHLHGAELMTAKPFPLPAIRHAGWWNSTPTHLYMRAVALNLGEPGPEEQEEARLLIETASAVSPLDPAVRLARAQGLAQPELGNLGLSRDVVSLRSTARVLLRAGNTDAALRAFRGALERIATSPPSLAPPPDFAEDTEFRRFLLPNEKLISGLLSELAEMGPSPLKFEEWSRVVPAAPVVALAALRTCLRAHDTATERAFELVESATVEGPSLPTERRATARAARAEALALKGDWDQAAECYRAAVELMPESLLRRSWAFNLAEIESRRGDIAARDEAWDMARGSAPSDPINRRLAQARQRAGVVASAPVSPNRRGSPRRDHALMRATGEAPP